MGKTFRLWKRTGSYGDALAAIGLGVLLQRLTNDDVFLEDKGGCFALNLKNELQWGDIDIAQLQADPLFWFVKLPPKKGKSSKQEAEDEGTGSVFLPQIYLDYEEEKRKFDLAREEEKRRKSGISDAESPRGYLPLFPLIQKLNILQALSARNKLHSDIRICKSEDLGKSIRIKLEAAERGEMMNNVTTPFSPKVPAVQAFNPAVGKGTNRSKSDGASRGPLPAFYTDWFEEWMRFIGSDLVLNSHSIDEDIKMSVPVPVKMKLSSFRLLKNEEVTKAWTSRKVDVLTVFKQVRFLMKHSSVSTPERDPVLQRGQRPKDTISTIQTGYFKKLNAHVLMNVSSLGLPGWFPVNELGDATLWLDLITEHEHILMLLDEAKSEESELLQLYRDFLCGNNWRLFLLFLGAYGCLLMRRREQDKGVKLRSFEKTNLEELMMKAETSKSTALPMMAIFQNEGFRQISSAIRQATVSEQFRKSRGQQIFDIHYGLFQEIKRKAKISEHLIAVIGDFVNSYNYENARRAEQLKDRAGVRRTNISDKDFEDFVSLFDSYSSETIAMLLIGFASCKEEKNQSQDQEQ